MLFDLASLTKPLVTAPLVFDHLPLDLDLRPSLGLNHHPQLVTARALLSHAAGLPPWLPYTGEPLAQQLAAAIPWGRHPLLKQAAPGFACYSDLSFRLLAEALEHTCGQRWQDLGQHLTHLWPAPWPEATTQAAPGPDREAWLLATDTPLPPTDPRQPHDCNARAGMKGHAGFAATAEQLAAWLPHWAACYAPRMAIDTAQTEDGTRWGLGLWRVLNGVGHFGHRLQQLPDGFGCRVLVDQTRALPAPCEAASSTSGPSADWWMHTGFTGPVLFFRPRDGSAIALLLHRAGPDGELLSAEALRARRLALLATLPPLISAADLATTGRTPAAPPAVARPRVQR